MPIDIYKYCYSGDRFDYISYAEELRTPLRKGGFLYATNIEVCVRVEDDPDICAVSSEDERAKNHPLEFRPMCEKYGSAAEVISRVENLSESLTWHNLDELEEGPPDNCAECLGDGHTSETCAECHGAGEVYCECCESTNTCKECRGAGYFLTDDPCPVCEGRELASGVIGDVRIRASVLSLLRTLPNPQIALEPGLLERGKIALRFDGGYGVTLKV